MFRWIRNRKAQSTAEYAIVIGLVIAAAVGMQTYVKRGLQGRIKDVVDTPVTVGTFQGASITFSGRQFDPGQTINALTTTHGGSETKGYTTGGTRSRTLTDYGITAQSGSQTELAPGSDIDYVP